MGISSSVEKNIEEGSEVEEGKPQAIIGQPQKNDIKFKCTCRLHDNCKSYKEKIARIEEGISALEDKRVRLYREHQCHHKLNGANDCSSYKDIELLLQYLTFIEVRSTKILIQTENSKKFVVDYLNRLGLTEGEAYTLYYHLKEDITKDREEDLDHKPHAQIRLERFMEREQGKDNINNIKEK